MSTDSHTEGFSDCERRTYIIVHRPVLNDILQSLALEKQSLQIRMCIPLYNIIVAINESARAKFCGRGCGQEGWGWCRNARRGVRSISNAVEDLRREYRELCGSKSECE